MMTMVETTTGPIEGREKDGTFFFAGIPYAAAPTESRRFRRAQAHEPWSEVLTTKKIGAAAPQLPGSGLSDAPNVRWDENCLTLNITTPGTTSNRRPVLVWIHGGAYRTGQGGIPWYNGARFALHGDMVVVSINYRLGALGFTDLSTFGTEYEFSGINGLLDQLLALEWVQQNIERFGGDPTKVTIAGESAGGFSVSTLLGMPATNGLYRHAIPQSGAAHHTLPGEAGKLVADTFLQELDADGPVQFMAASAEQILQAQRQTIKKLETPDTRETLGVSVSAFYPVVGNALLPESPLDAIRAGIGSDVAVMTGSNHHETTLWGYEDQINDSQLERRAREMGDEHLLQRYRNARPNDSATDLMTAISTDFMFRIPAIRLLEARTYTERNWLYQFNWESRAFSGNLKATHALEIPFAFDNLDQAGVDNFIGPGPTPQHVADRMHRAWIEFICDGNPGWAPYSSEARNTMIFDDESGQITDPESQERNAWEGIR